jgi:hypothetical protein
MWRYVDLALTDVSGLVFMKDVFRQNGYNDRQIHRVLNRRPNIRQPEDNPDSVASYPMSGQQN